MTFPCKNCIERHTDCWSICPKYQAEKEKSQAVLDARKKYYGEVSDFIVDIARAKKRMRKRK